jgi:hypothetical protein
VATVIDLDCSLYSHTKEQVATHRDL